MSILSERLQEAIELRGMSQKRLAEEAGTSESNVSRYLGDNRNPRSTQIVVDMAVALKVSTDFLFGLTNLPNGAESIGADEKILLSCYQRSSDDDKKVLWALLGKYMTANEKDYIEQLNSTKAKDIG